SRARRRSLVRPRRDHYLPKAVRRSRRHRYICPGTTSRCGRPRKPKRPAQKPPRSLTASAPCSSAAAALGPTAPLDGRGSLTFNSSHISPSMELPFVRLAAHVRSFVGGPPGNVKLF